MILKYIFDRVVSLVGLLFLWPVLLIIAIMVKIKMPGGPAFFVQKRVGKDGKLFNCHKFRTMRVQSHTESTDNTEKAKANTNDTNGTNASTGWSTVSVAGDSRITPFGATLRHYKLDELPGLWDVLIGNMSFVGPRPDVPGYADELQGDDRDVLKLRPGITGPATLKYRLEDEMISEYVAQKQSAGDTRPMQEIAVEYNDNVIYPDKVRLNCYYYRHYSFIKDIKMIFCTVLGKNMEYAGEVI
jgi:lipopolysaccharide/colanic/teichoic acid biosynthesis glycosyltransferase